MGGLPKRLGEKLLNNNSSHEGGDKEISTGTSQMQIFFLSTMYVLGNDNLHPKLLGSFTMIVKYQ